MDGPSPSVGPEFRDPALFDNRAQYEALMRVIRNRHTSREFDPEGSKRRFAARPLMTFRPAPRSRAGKFFIEYLVRLLNH